MRTRQELEDIEFRTLAPYASLSKNSKGRVINEKEHDYRTAYQRDRDRIVHTSAFRRLEYKTQVFVNHEGDYYRTRLTHSLEVSQIAKTIARALGLNEDLTDAVCLAHDLGHTPFGHAGQDVMEVLMKSYGGFEHNEQSFRILTYLETPYPDFVGLNLSSEVLEGVMKHSKSYNLPDGTPFERDEIPSLEAQLCNIADSIAYNNHDVDDGLKSGLLDVGDLKEIPIWEERYQVVKKEHADHPFPHQVRMTVRKMINDIATDLIATTTQNIKENGIHSFEDVKTKGKNIVDFSENMKAQMSQLKSFLFKHLYRHYRVERMADKAKRILQDLFVSYQRNPNTIPHDFKDRYHQDEDIERIVCDYIAGMTDRFAIQEYGKMFDPHTKV